MTPGRPSLAHARRVRRMVTVTSAVAAVVVAVLALTNSLTLSSQEPVYEAPTGPAPWDFTTSAWDEALGGDEALTTERYADLAKYVDPDLGTQTDAVRALSEQVATADLTASGKAALATLTPNGIAPYWPAAPASGADVTPQCVDVAILATSPAALPVEGSDERTLGLFTRYSKSLVAFTGSCGGQQFTTEYPGVRYVYAGLGDNGWVPLRYWQLPSASALDSTPGATEPYEWELTSIPADCQTTTLVRARIAVADALAQMCQAAAGDGVTLRVVSGYRTRAEQASVFRDAVTAYGSQQAARRYVAYADGDVCTSKHCSGLAVNVDETSPALQWLSATVGCVDAAGQVTAATQCPAGATPVANAARWGFSSPLKVSPGYLEFTVPLASDSQSSLATPNCAPAGVPVANQVAAVFRCRLAREGIVGAEQEHVVAQALTVSRCESGWNAAAAGFGGRFATQPNPVTGRTYTNRGVFMITAELARDGWVAGGADALSDPLANINAAASLWLTTRDWSQFGCATGDVGSFEAGPVLPEYGGEALPAWASQY